MRLKGSNKFFTMTIPDLIPKKMKVAVSGGGASLYRYWTQLSGKLWVRLPMPIGQFSDIKFSSCNVRRGWFICIECGLWLVDLGSFPA